MATELMRIKEASKDFIVPTEMLVAQVVDVPSRNTIEADAGMKRKDVALTFENGKRHTFGVNDWSAGQLAGVADIPKPYFDRIRKENPVLLADSINHGLDRVATVAKASGKRDSRMVRTLDGRVRGLLSSRYRVLDAHDLLVAVAPTMIEKGMEVVSTEITESKFYIKALSPRLKADIKPGDTVQYGLTISTSDVGAGSVRVEPLLFRLVCSNGMISNTALRKFHVGRNQSENEVRELFSDKTRELGDAAFWAEVRDVVLGSMRPEQFEAQVDRLRLAANEEIKNFDLPRVVELAMKATGIGGEAKQNSILAALASGNEGAALTKWGLINSFTRAAHAMDIGYEESIEMERAGGKILELSPKEWSTISAVAQ